MNSEFEAFITEALLEFLIMSLGKNKHFGCLGGDLIIGSIQ